MMIDKFVHDCMYSDRELPELIMILSISDILYVCNAEE